MAMEAATIESLIRAGLPDAEVRIDDLRGDGEHYAAHVVSPSFRGLNRIQQHRMVYAALGNSLSGQLHALALTTAAP